MTDAERKMTMPIITPRQIVEAINSMFGQPTTDLGSVPHWKQSEVRTLLSLLDQLPPDLVNLPFHDFLEFSGAAPFGDSAS